jgi:hypothetical protein
MAAIMGWHGSIVHRRAFCALTDAARYALMVGGRRHTGSTIDLPTIDLPTIDLPIEESDDE